MMMKFSERRARERAAKIMKQGPLEAAGASVCDFRLEIAQTISLLDDMSRRYARGAVSPHQDSGVMNWAATAGPIFGRLSDELSAVNAGLIRVMNASGAP